MRGAADPEVQAAAIRLLTEQLLPASPLWPIYGERWREPRYYSLLMQVCVAVAACRPYTMLAQVGSVCCP